MRIVGLEETCARPVHADAAWHEVGGERQGVAVALLNAGDLAGTLQPREHAFQFLLLVVTQAESCAQLDGIECCVIRPFKQAENLIFHVR